ncbi:MAG: hypothetical protein QW390_04090 [Candidatus Bathyarchaeia archaeon]
MILSRQDQVNDLNLVSLRLLFIFSGAFLLFQGFENWIYGKPYSHVEVVILILATYILSFILFVFSLSGKETILKVRHLALISLIFVTLFGGYVMVAIEFKWTYRTDSIAFTHYAALQFIEGLRQGMFVNPYRMDLQLAFETFPIEAYFLTFTQIGDVISRLNYPAMHFLIYLPFILSGVSDMRAVLFLFMIITLCVIYWRAPPEIRPLTLIPFYAGSHLMIKFTAGCVTDPLWILPLTVSTLYIDRPRVSGIFFGIAAAMKQEPWILGPFILIWFFKEGRNKLGTLRGLRDFTLYTALAFTLPNLAFIIDAPREWLTGVLEPLFGELVVLSQGLSMLTQMGIFPLGKAFYFVMVIAITAILLVNYYVYYDNLKYAVFIFPAIIMWFSYRGLNNYFTSMIPVVTASFVVWYAHQRVKTV